MSQASVKKAVAKIFSDADFKKAFMKDPQKTLEKSEFALTADEILAVSKINAEDLKVNVTKGGIGPRAEIEVGVTAIKKFKPGPAVGRNRQVK